MVRIRSIHPAIVVIFFLLAPLYNTPAAGTSSILVQNVDGTVKLQHNGSSGWSTLSNGTRLSDNDIIETFIGSRVILKLENGTAIIGSNSRVLASIQETKSDIGFSVLNGGVLIKTAGHGRYSVSTGSGIAELNHGAIAVSMEPIGNQTGVFALADTIVFHGIMQQKEQKLAQGQVSFIRSGAAPVPPTPLTLRQVSVLSRLFGDSSIASQLKSSAIVPVDDKTIDNTIYPVGIDSIGRKPAKLQTYPRLFDKNRIFGAIVDNEKDSSRPYAPATEPLNTTGRNLSVGLFYDAGICNGSGHPLATFVPRWTDNIIDAALKLQIAENDSSDWIWNYHKSRKTFYNPIDHITIGSIPDSLYITAGTITDLTIGNGAIVNHFRNVDDNLLFQPIGISGQVKVGDFAAQGFLADVNNPNFGAVYVSVSPSSYYLGAGLYVDAKQNGRGVDTANVRYAASPSLIPDSNEYNERALIYELDFNTLLAQNAGISMNLRIDFAQLVLNGNNDGFLLKGPEWDVDWNRSSLQVGFAYQSGRLVSNEFDQFYYSRRTYFDLINPLSYSQMEDTVHHSTIKYPLFRNQAGLYGSYRFNPARGIALEIGAAHDFYSRDKGPDTSMPGVRLASDFSYSFSISADSNFIPFMSYVTLFADQSHGALFSWLNSEAGFSFLTKPIYGVALQAGGRYFFIAQQSPSAVIPLDRKEIFELSAGLIWGVL